MKRNWFRVTAGCLSGRPGRETGWQLFAQRPVRRKQPDSQITCSGIAPCGSSIKPIGSRQPATAKQGRKCRRLHTVGRSSVQRTFHCPGHTGDSQIRQVHWKANVMNRPGCGCGGIAAAWTRSLARQFYEVVDGPDIHQVDLTRVGEAAACNALFQQFKLAGAVCATEAKPAPVRSYSASAAQRQPERRRLPARHCHSESK